MEKLRDVINAMEKKTQTKTTQLRPKLKLQEDVFKATKLKKHSKETERVLLNTKKLIMGNKLQEYMTDTNFTLNLVCMLFSLRSHTYKLTKKNFSYKYKDNMFCELCKIFPCSQKHILKCPKIQAYLHINNFDNNFKEVEYEWIYGSANEQLRVTQAYEVLSGIKQSIILSQEDPKALVP